MRAYSNTIFVSGFLLFWRPGSVFAQAFDASRAQTQGETTMVAQKTMTLEPGVRPQVYFLGTGNSWT